MNDQSILIIDVHTHAFPDFLARKALDALTQHSEEYKPIIDGTINGLLRSMDDAGIAKSFVANIATRPAQARAILEWSSSITSDRIIPLGSVHPESPDWENELCAVKQAGFPGIKLHPQYQGFVVDDAEMNPFYETIASLGLFVLFHAGYDVAFPGDDSASPERFARVNDRFPLLKIIAAHLGGWRDWRNVREQLAGRDIFIDTSFLHEADDDTVMTILTKHSRDRVLFASDSPWLSQSDSVRTIAMLPIDDDYKLKIFGENAAGLLSLNTGSAESRDET